MRTFQVSHIGRVALEVTRFQQGTYILSGGMPQAFLEPAFQHLLWEYMARFRRLIGACNTVQVFYILLDRERSGGVVVMQSPDGRINSMESDTTRENVPVQGLPVRADNVLPVKVQIACLLSFVEAGIVEQRYFLVSEP